MTVVVPLLAFNTLAAAILGLFLLHHRGKSASPPLFTALTAVTIWIVAYALELGAGDLPAGLFWANVQFIGIGLAPIAWLETTRRMVGHRPLGPLGLAFLAVIPAVTVALAFTWNAHDLFRGDPQMHRFLGLTLIHADYRWFHNLVFVPFQYILYLSGLVVILESMNEANARFRKGYLLLIGGMILPWIGGLLYVLSIPPFADFNPTPLFLLVTIAMYLAVLRREDLLDLAPIGRRQIVENLQEGVVVLDSRGRIVDVNPTALTLLPELDLKPPGAIIGRRLRDVAARHVPLVLLADGIEETETAFQVEIDDKPRYYLVRPTVITDPRGAFRGRALSILDITTATRLVQSLQNERSHTDLTLDSTLLNRRDFFRRLDHEVRRSAAFQRPLSIARLRSEAGVPEQIRREQEERLNGACGPLFWMSWLTPEELVVLVPETDPTVMHDKIVDALVDTMTVAGIHTEVGHAGLTREEFILNARRSSER